MFETLNLAIERYNAGDLSEALRLASLVPDAQRDAPDAQAALAAIGEALAGEARGETIDGTLEAATVIVSRPIAAAAWSRAAAECLKRPDTAVALHAACFALDVDPGEITPTMQPGDVLLFLGTVPHRTYLTPSMTKPRRSLELRFVPADWLMTAMATA